MPDLRPLTDGEIMRAHRLWRDHHLDTRSIASVLGTPEATIWNYLEFVKHGVAPSKARQSA